VTGITRETFELADLRVNQIIHIAAALNGGDEISSDLHHYLTYDADQFTINEWGWPPDDIDRWEMGERIHDERRYGWLLEVATPVATNFSADGRAWQASWGHTHLGWVYAATYEAAVEKAVAWSAAQRDRDRAKSIDGRQA
jgi:hypothetical protein